MRIVSQLRVEGMILNAFGNLPDLYRDSRIPTLAIIFEEDKCILFVDLDYFRRESGLLRGVSFVGEMDLIFMGSEFCCDEVCQISALSRAGEIVEELLIFKSHTLELA